MLSYVAVHLPHIGAVAEALIAPIFVAIVKAARGGTENVPRTPGTSRAVDRDSKWRGALIAVNAIAEAPHISESCCRRATRRHQSTEAGWHGEAMRAWSKANCGQKHVVK